MKEFARHLSSLFAPVMVSLVIPALLLAWEGAGRTRAWLPPPLGLRFVGGIVALAGFVLAVFTIRMFIRIAQGTIMPWDPSRRLITGSLYAYIRNPMILSLLVVLAGDALLFASPGIAWMAVIFFAVNTVYFIYSEEPGLEKRFGAEYREYKRNVPRWIPRCSPWKPGQDKGGG